MTFTTPGQAHLRLPPAGPRGLRHDRHARRHVRLIRAAGAGNRPQARGGPASIRSRSASSVVADQSDSIHQVAPADLVGARDLDRSIPVGRRRHAVDHDLERPVAQLDRPLARHPVEDRRQDLGGRSPGRLRPLRPGRTARPSAPPGASSARAARRRRPRRGSVAAARAWAGRSSARTGSARPRMRTARLTRGRRGSRASRRAVARVRAPRSARPRCRTRRRRASRGLRGEPAARRTARPARLPPGRASTAGASPARTRSRPASRARCAWPSPRARPTGRTSEPGRSRSRRR